MRLNLCFFSLDFVEMLDFLHVLTANNRVVLSPVNNNGDFIASLCYHLLIMTGANIESSNDVDGHYEGEQVSENAAGIL